MHLLQINTAGFNEAIKSDTPVAIKIFAQWCHACAPYSPVVEKVAEKTKGVAFLELDIDKSPEVPERLNITGVPTIVMFQSGIETGRLTGSAGESKVQDFIDKNISRNSSIIA